MPTIVNPRKVKRHHLMRQHVELSTKVLEVGPLARPVAPKRAGFNCYYVDHLDRDGLIRHYAHAGYDPDSIEEVDFIWKDGDLRDAVPLDHHGTFEVIILSHVLEHLPNPLAFLESCATLLRPGGYVTLALPDKRFCFDLFRPVTTTSDWLDAYRDGRSLHTDSSLFDHATLAVARQAQISWTDVKHATTDLTFLNMSVDRAYARFFEREEKSQSYEDCHASVLTPAAFALIMQECQAIGIAPLTLDYVSSVRGDEFIAHLKLSKRAPITHHDRLQLLTLSAREQLDGFRHIKAADPSPVREFIKRLKKRAAG
ncbi:class I SAM-dependent methyltransferase [Rhizobium sp. RCC_161_2]|uniref:class I SAM-dependent methyltransferase n=1 Tax=Rhizobium sp. RCC_161_2 TaxID=3239219 RepID=UPI00352324CA